MPMARFMVSGRAWGSRYPMTTSVPAFFCERAESSME